MLDQARLMEMLSDITQIAGTQGNILTQKEIQDYFKETGLAEEQLTAVYQYLVEKKVRIQGYYTPGKLKEPEEKDGEDSAYLSAYFEELAGLKELNTSEEEELYVLARSGDAKARSRLIEGWLARVVELAKQYRGRGVLTGDLIQQGNEGLILGVDSLKGRCAISNSRDYLEESVRKAMEDYIDEMMECEDQSDAFVGKMNLMHEAARILSEDLGRTPTRSELAEYTHMDQKEIEDILGYTKEF